MRIILTASLLLVLASAGQAPRFQLEEATIADVHRAIREGQITCRGLVQGYLNRAAAYNGVSDRLVTRDGAAIPAAPGTVRAGSRLKVPTQTVAIATLLHRSINTPDRRLNSGEWKPPRPILMCSSSTASMSAFCCGNCCAGSR